MHLSRGLYNGLETGREDPSDWVVQQVNIMERLGVDALADEPRGLAGGLGKSREIAEPRKVPEEARPGPAPRRLQVVSWAHAGQAASYEELPKEWQRTVYSDCSDPDAFAIEIEGDSMEKEYREGDVAIVMPSIKPVNHSLVIAKLKTDGITFKMLSFVGPGGKTIRLSSLNPVYAPADYTERDFHWIYPVHSVTRMVWRRR